MSMPELKVAENAATAAGSILSRYYRDGVSMRTKDVSNFVSDADIEAENAIADIIKSAFPDHAILGEETHQGDVKAEHLWIVDPLDGTTNFAHRIPQFAVSIAYYHRGEPACGVVLNPIRDEWHVAVRGQGATFNGARVQVAPHKSLNETLVALGFYYDRGRIMEATLAAVADFKRLEVHGIRRFGAAALDLCMVGLGQTGAYFEYSLSPWDFAAGRLFVEEAGGRVTTAFGGPLPIAKSGILASNGLLHDAVLNVIRIHNPTPSPL